MILAVNTVIQWKEGSERDEFERILWLSRDDNLAVIFPLTPSVSAKTFPQYCVLSEIEGAIKDGIAVQRTIDPYARLADSDLLKRFGDKKMRHGAELRTLLWMNLIFIIQNYVGR